LPVDKGNTKSKQDKKKCCDYPISIFFIVVNEFCERFSYYGMRAVLVLYFRYFLRWDDDLATTIYHTFVALCYLTPILGAIVADSWLGKFKTIIYLSMVYTIGQAVLAVSAIHDITDFNRDGIPDDRTLHVVLSMIGLFLIAIGTGGIKPCVAAFGGDQFQEHQEKQRSTFFSIFYLSINAGSLLSTIITPILRGQNCGIHTQQRCYPLAFGVPAALMAVALVVFIVGSSMYVKAAPKGNIMLDVCKCIGFALKNRFRHRDSQYPAREHWMDWASEKYDKLLIEQVKMVVKVLFLYIPLPMFWALFDQQVCVCVCLCGALIIQPDQMQTVNPILILLLVPIVDRIVYPLIKLCGLNFSPLRRMTVGMLFAAVAFVAAALVQIQIDKTLPDFPSSSQSQFKFLNLQNTEQSVQVGGQTYHVPAFQSSGDYQTVDTSSISTVINGTTFNIPLTKEKRQTILISTGLQPDLCCRFVNGFSSILNVSWSGEDLGAIVTNDDSNYTMVSQGKRVFTIESPGGPSCLVEKEFGFGSSYTFLIASNVSFGPDVSRCEVVWTPVCCIHQTQHLPHGDRLRYAPSNMKSVLQAGWLLTVAVGNIIVLIVAEAAQLPDQWAEYVLFASLLLAVSIIFGIMAYYYTYVDPAEIEARFADKEEKKRPDPERLTTCFQVTIDEEINSGSLGPQL
uniref:Solute carrier family 15 member 1 n=1 Tax=Denticeps clupeoides TaxID=299321 RepID=A0AAY4AQ42_9TELE